LGIGSALTRAGPLSVLLGYSFTGVAVFAMMQCLGEMATWLPLPGAIPQFCARYVDDALGFAVGWNVSLDLHSDLSEVPKSEDCKTGIRLQS
jgi:amino acid transporter